MQVHPLQPSAEDVVEIAVITMTVKNGGESLSADTPKSSRTSDTSQRQEAQAIPTPQATEVEQIDESEEEALASQSTLSGEELHALTTHGAGIYAQRCAACHGPMGIGRRDYFPTLRGNRFVTVEDPTSVIEIVLYGQGLMPPFRKHLSDTDIAAVITYLRGA